MQDSCRKREATCCAPLARHVFQARNIGNVRRNLRLDQPKLPDRQRTPAMRIVRQGQITHKRRRLGQVMLTAQLSMAPGIGASITQDIMQAFIPGRHELMSR